LSVKSNEFAVGPMTKASRVRASCDNTGSVAACYGKEGSARSVGCTDCIHACQIGQFGMHKGSLKYTVDGLDKSVHPVVVGFLYTKYVGIEFIHGLIHATLL